MDFETLYRNAVVNVGTRIVGEDAKSQCKAVFEAMVAVMPKDFDLSNVKKLPEYHELYNDNISLEANNLDLEERIEALKKENKELQDDLDFCGKSF